MLLIPEYQTVHYDHDPKRTILSSPSIEHLASFSRSYGGQKSLDSTGLYSFANDVKPSCAPKPVEWLLIHS